MRDGERTRENDLKMGDGGDNSETERDERNKKIVISVEREEKNRQG